MGWCDWSVDGVPRRTTWINQKSVSHGSQTRRVECKLLFCTNRFKLFRRLTGDSCVQDVSFAGDTVGA